MNLFNRFLSIKLPPNTHERGYWIGDVSSDHFFDVGLAPALVDFFKKESCSSIVDFGCGMGEYVKYLKASGLYCEGYDGNPNTPELSEGFAQVADLSVPLELKRKFNWVLSLEVGEHIPKKYERIFIENLIKHCQSGIVLSWALKGQGGQGHFNERSNRYIKKVMKKHGLINDVEAETFLRENARANWLQNTIMVFRSANQ